MPDGDIIHIVGVALYVGSHVRQRCGWCGAVLVDGDEARIAVPTDMLPVCPECDGAGTWDRAAGLTPCAACAGTGRDRPRIPIFEPGRLIAVTGDRNDFRAMSIVDHRDDDPLPPNACGQIPHDITGA